MNDRQNKLEFSKENWDELEEKIAKVIHYILIDSDYPQKGHYNEFG